MLADAVGRTQLHFTFTQLLYFQLTYGLINVIIFINCNYIEYIFIILHHFAKPLSVDFARHIIHKSFKESGDQPRLAEVVLLLSNLHDRGRYYLHQLISHDLIILIIIYLYNNIVIKWFFEKIRVLEWT